MTPTTTAPRPALSAALTSAPGATPRIALSGAAEAADARLLPAVRRLLDGLPQGPVELDLAELNGLGGRGIGALEELCQDLERRGFTPRLVVQRDDLRRAIAELGRPAPPPRARPAAGSAWHRLLVATLQTVDGFLSWALLLREALLHAVLQVVRPPRGRRALLFRALRDVGARAAGLVALIATLIGAVLAIQGGQLLQLYGQEVLIADLVALSMVKEIGPLVTAILVAGRSGSAMTAEIGTMKVTEEIDALRVLGVAPVGWLVAPRLLAMVVALPLLAVLANVVGIVGGLLVATGGFGVSADAYAAEVRAIIEIDDVLSGLLKAAIFALLIVSIAAWNGFRTAGGAGDVGRRTTRAVVQSIVWVIAVNALFTFIEWRWS